MNPIQAAKILWIEKGTFDPDLMLEAKRYVDANPLCFDRQYLKILTELKERKPRMGDGETLTLIRRRKTELEKNGNRTRILPATNKKSGVPLTVEPDYLEIDV